MLRFLGNIGFLEITWSKWEFLGIASLLKLLAGSVKPTLEYLCISYCNCLKPLWKMKSFRTSACSRDLLASSVFFCACPPGLKISGLVQNQWRDVIMNHAVDMALISLY